MILIRFLFHHRFGKKLRIIGILLRAIRRKQKTTEEVVAILRDLPHQSTLHIRTKLLEEIIGRLENEI